MVVVPEPSVKGAGALFGVVWLSTPAAPPPGAALAATELFAVAMEQLAWPPAFVTDGRLKPEPAEPAHPDPGQDPRDRRERHPERLGDLSCGETDPAQLRDRLDPVGRGSIGDMPRRR